MKKKGFTLVEIIICVLILSVVSTISVIGVSNIKKNNSIRQLEDINANLTSALEVYISNNPEIEENLILNAKAAVITLETLKNEGLIKDNIINPTTGEKFDYKKNYFTLLEGFPGETPIIGGSYDCNLDLVGIEVITTWNLNDLNTSDVIYICPRKDYTKDIESLKNSVSDISSEINAIKDKINEIQTGGGASGSVKGDLKLNTLYDELTYTAKGTNPNNWVIFEVTSNSSNFAYFPNNADKNLWRILTIDADGKIKLVYNQAVVSNNFSNYTTTSSQWCDGGMKDSEKDSCTFYNLKHVPSGEPNIYYKYRTTDGFWVNEMYEEVTVSGSKKKALYDNIKYNNWIVSNKYNMSYTVDNNGSNITNTTATTELKMGAISYFDIQASINISDSWLFGYTTQLGYINKSISFESYYLYVYSNNGNLAFGHRRSAETRCTSSSCNKTKDSSSHMRLTTGQYHPVITLNAKVDLVEPTCSEGVKPGSKECPYKLTCKDC